jgi:alanyl-tRNA synthetase
MSIMTTQRLYYEQGALSETTARVVAIGGEPGRPVVALDRTIFFPGGGGQPCDLGHIAGIAVCGVAERDGLILHELSSPLPEGLEVGSRLRIAIDADRRREYMERHTGQHLLSAVFLRVSGAATRSVHHGPEFSTIDFASPSLDEETLSACEDEANRIIAEDYRLITHLCPPEALDSFNLRRVPPLGKETIRVVEIDGYDYTPCCGVHAPSTSCLRLAKIIGAERYKGLMRISFVAGGSALANYKQIFRKAAAAAKALGISMEGIEGESSRLLALCKELETERAALLREWAGREADLAIGAASGSPPRFVFARRSSSERALAELTARAIASSGSIGMIASERDLTVHAAAPEPSAALGARLAPVAKECGGRGGGGPTLFRVSFVEREKFDIFIQKASIILSKL